MITEIEMKTIRSDYQLTLEKFNRRDINNELEFDSENELDDIENYSETQDAREVIRGYTSEFLAEKKICDSFYKMLESLYEHQTESDFGLSDLFESNDNKTEETIYYVDEETKEHLDACEEARQGFLASLNALNDLNKEYELALDAINSYNDDGYSIYSQLSSLNEALELCMLSESEESTQYTADEPACDHDLITQAYTHQKQRGEDHYANKIKAHGDKPVAAYPSSWRKEANTIVSGLTQDDAALSSSLQQQLSQILYDCIAKQVKTLKLQAGAQYMCSNLTVKANQFWCKDFYSALAAHNIQQPNQPGSISVVVKGCKGSWKLPQYQAARKPRKNAKKQYANDLRLKC